MTSPDSRSLEFYKTKLMNEFEIKDKGNLKYFLGLEINYDRESGILKLSQGKYIKGILKRFNFENCKPTATPIDPKLKLNSLESQDQQSRPVKPLIGCLMYLMLGSRPDISFSVNYFSRLQDKNVNGVWIGLKRLLRYLSSTCDTYLKYKRDLNISPLICFVDSDWAGDLVDRKSVTGFIIKVYGNTVAWVTRKQKCISLSSSESELVALCDAVRECLFFKRLLADLNVVTTNFKVYEDNQACISLIKNPENNKRVKHIDLKFNFICDAVSKGVMTLEYTSTKLQQADILTKGQNKDQFYSNKLWLGIID